MTKKEVEIRAIDLVKQWLKNEGIEAWDSKENKGYDLETSDNQWIEVKGRSGSSAPVLVYESVFEKNDTDELKRKYRISIVNNVGTQPELIIIKPSDNDWSERNIRVLKPDAIKEIEPIRL
ncbi:MAG: DUF3883 domain-containing protein [Nitrospinae bacterium]|nr:DUF3883 domain-containing protein [Nitrospinota bacterium]